jgi:hypothetical protein
MNVLRFFLHQPNPKHYWHINIKDTSPTCFMEHKKPRFSANCQWQAIIYKVLQGAPFIHNWHQQRSYYRQQNLGNNRLSLAISFKPDILCSLQVLHLYQIMLEIHLWFLYRINTVHLVGAINWVYCIVSVEDAMGYLLKETGQPLDFFRLVALWVATVYSNIKTAHKDNSL